MIILRLCSTEDIHAILELQESVFADLGDQSDLLRRNTQETFERCTKEPNFTIGVFDKERLIAICIMEDARGRNDDLGISIKNDLVRQSVYADSKLVMVKKEYRGLGLQKALMGLLEINACKRGYQYLLTSVSPDNAYSRSNIIGMGYVYDTDKTLYGGLKREIYIKTVSDTPCKETAAFLSRDDVRIDTAIQ